MLSENLRTKLSLLPPGPGCYLMKSAGEIIYVGKAVNLKNRVKSYFHAKEHTPKVAAMVQRIDDFDIMLCSSNLEALLLECNLIKTHRPYYNILLKDDKHYPYLRIQSKEPFPRLEIVRKTQDDGAMYFGPYIGTGAVTQVFYLMRKLFPLRTCKMALPQQRKIRPCVQYEIKQCPAPCAGLCTPEDYRPIVQDVVSFLKGHYAPVVERLKKEMQEAAAQFQFERAAELRDALFDTQSLMEQQSVLTAKAQDEDVFAVYQDGLDAMVQVLYIRGGKMLGGDAYPLSREGKEDPAAVLEGFLTQFYQMRTPPRAVVAQGVQDAETLAAWLKARRGAAVSLIVPKRGEKKERLDMALKNAQSQLEKRNARQAVRHERTIGAMEELQQALGLSSLPRRIEGFDISNTGGELSVASMVVFIDGVPAKKEYRRFRIKTVVGANDFASMNEVLTRRFQRVKAEKENERWPLPDLILVDGGPQQLRFARAAMLKEGFDVPMFGLAKKQEEIFLPHREAPIVLDRKSTALHLIQFIRDESHRFAITHHRGLREKEAVKSSLEAIPGIGKQRRRNLLSHLGSVKKVQQASVEELAAIPGMNKNAAQTVYDFFHAPAHAGKTR